MSENRPRDSEGAKQRWDERASTYDEWYTSFEGALEHQVDWTLLEGYLPRDPHARILDAAGGTGRIALPLARLGYSMTLCDISVGMLSVARRKFCEEGLCDRLHLLQCDVHKLPFARESYDFVLCWDGQVEAVRELIRVAKKGAALSVFLINKYGAALRMFREDPASALALMRSESHYAYDGEERYRAVNVEEARELFEKQGVRVLDIYAVCGMLSLLCIPQDVRESCAWDRKLFAQVTEMLLGLSKEPSAKALSRHLVVYGKKA